MEQATKEIVTQEDALMELADPYWRLTHLYKIKTKDERLMTFEPKPAQKDYLEHETLRDKILKARQLGFSTLKLLQKLDYAMFNDNVNVAIIAHLKEKVTSLFEIVKLAYEHMPEEIRPYASRDNVNELVFPESNSKIYVALDLRSETVHNLHVSEIAFMKQADRRMLGILEAVPKTGIISFETTANGMAGWFYDLWTENPLYAEHFYNWLWDEEYSIGTDKTMDELSLEYHELQIRYELIPDAPERFSMTKGQLQWYVNKILSQKELVKQEYPLTAEESFISSGNNVFHFSDIQKHLAISPIDRKYGDLFVWEQPLRGFRYVIGCDPSEGLGGDNAVIEVINTGTGNQAAEFAMNNIPTDHLGGLLIDIGKFYNNAWINLEINSIGIAVLNHIKTKYANIYHREVFDKRSKEKKRVLGWKTTMVTKPQLVSDLEEAVRNEDIQINSKEALNELRTFVRTDSSGYQGYGAEGTKYDDRVIALGLAVQMIKDMPAQKAPKTLAQIIQEEYVAKTKAPKIKAPIVVNRLNRPNYKIRGINR